MSLQGRWLVDGKHVTRDEVKSLLAAWADVRVMLNKIRLCKGGLTLENGKHIKFVPPIDR